MKKINPGSIENPGLSESEAIDLTFPSEVTQHRISARLRNPGRVDPVSRIFKIHPDADAVTLLAHASKDLASLNAMTTDLTDQLEGPHRNVAVAIQQLTGLAEMLINQALENLDSPPEPTTKAVCH